MTALRILDAEGGAHLEHVRALVAEYAQLPHVIGRWTDPAAEVAALPGEYASPSGLVLLATRADHPVGCVGLRALEPPAVCEMKRLYVSPAGRGLGVGEALVRALLTRAAALGYTTMRLDTAPELLAAQQLYDKLGFTRIARYALWLPEDAVCFERAC